MDYWEVEKRVGKEGELTQIQLRAIPPYEGISASVHVQGIVDLKDETNGGEIRIEDIARFAELIEELRRIARREMPTWGGE